LSASCPFEIGEEIIINLSLLFSVKVVVVPPSWLNYSRLNKFGHSSAQQLVLPPGLSNIKSKKLDSKSISAIWLEVEICGNRNTSTLNTRLRWPRFFPLAQKCPESPQEAPLLPSAVIHKPIFRHRWGAFEINLALNLYFHACFRYRVVAKSLSIFAQLSSATWEVPSFYSVRHWALRLGLYRLQNPRLGPRWALICDHTASYSTHKLFVVCGVDLDMLDKRKANGTGNFSLSHKDMQPLAIVPMGHSAAEILLKVIQKCIQQHGLPEQMVTDGGADILKAARLLKASQLAVEQTPTKHVYDISHQIACLIKHELESMAEWIAIEARVTLARAYCTYRARHLSPPTLRQGSDRWMNLMGILTWFKAMLVLFLPGQEQAVTHPGEGEVTSTATPLGKAILKPRLGLTKAVWKEWKAANGKQDGVRAITADICGREYSSPSAYEEALMQQSPKMPTEAKAHFLANGDLNTIYLNDIMGGSEKQDGFIQEVSAMLEFTNTLQKHLKENGVTHQSVRECEELRAGATLQGVGHRVGEKVLAVVRELALGLEEGQRVLATSDVIESLNGKWKTLIRAASNPALGSNALLLPALMHEPTEAEIKTALETVSVDETTEWRNQNFDQTFHQAKREVRPPKPSPKHRPSLAA
jgi:hypothetical protein